MILLIDNYDSFTYNLVHYLGELGAEVVVHRNDKIGVGQALSAGAKGIVISPGPCDPDRAGICLDLIAQAPEDLPIFGVCLGYQAISQSFGGDIVRVPPMHGKLSTVHHTGKGVFEGVDQDFAATRYHSLSLAPASVPDCLEVTATAEDGVIMAVQHRSRPIHGVQFHPESIRTQHGHLMIKNFLKTAGIA